MAGTSEGGIRAARTRGYASLSEAGRKGGRNSRRKARTQEGRNKNAPNQKEDKEE